MRLIILIALIGIVAARCPYGSKRCFNQLLQSTQNRYGMMNQYNDQETDDNEYNTNQYNDIDDDSTDEYDQQDNTQQQNCQCYNGICQCDQYQENNYNEQCEHGDMNCYIRQQQQQQQGSHQQQCQPRYNLLRQLEQANCQLASKLYKQAKQDSDDKNTVVSPAALQLTLAALQNGAQGNTKQQMKRVQCPRLTKQQCQQANAALIRSLKGTNNVQQTQRQGQQTYGRQQATINVATAIIVNQNTSPKRHFIQTVQKCLGGQVTKCSFKTNPQQCRHQINEIVSQKTNGKCQNTVPKQAVTTNTKMIAASAFQMQAKFSQQFRQQQTTKRGHFYPLGSKQSKSCQIIQSQGKFNYYEDEDTKVVGIQTQQHELTLYVIVPKRKNGLNQVEKEKVQNGQQLKQMLDTCDQQKQHITVQIPTFQVKTKLDAKQTLLKQGIQAAFDNDQADFTHITGLPNGIQDQQGQNTHLNKVIQQATIKVTSQGISAATTHGNEQYDTQDEFEEMLYQQQYTNQYNGYGSQTQVKANHAFAFAVKHNPSNQIVLVGRVVDPSQNTQNQQQYDGDQTEYDQ